MTRSVAGLGAFEAATVAVRAASTSAPAGLELVFELELKFARLVDLISEIARAGFVSNFFCSGFFDSLLLFTAAPTFDPAACAERKHRSRGLALVQWQGGGMTNFDSSPPIRSPPPSRHPRSAPPSLSSPSSSSFSPSSSFSSSSNCAPCSVVRGKSKGKIEPCLTTRLSQVRLL